MTEKSTNILALMCTDLNQALAASCKKHIDRIRQHPNARYVPCSALGFALATQCIGVGLSDKEAIEAFAKTLVNARERYANGRGFVVQEWDLGSEHKAKA